MNLNKALILQIITFGCVGVIATLVHYGVALALSHYGLLAVYFANVVGYLCAVGVSLFGHSFFTYKKKITSTIVTRFVVVSLSSLALSLCILFVLERWLALAHSISLAVIVLSIPVLTFIVNKFWVYAEAVAHHQENS